MADKLHLRMALGKHDHVRPLVDGRVSSSRIDFEFLDIAPLPKAFRQMVRGSDIDVSEMAVATHLLAHHFGKPITGLAIPLWSRLPHTNLVCDAATNLNSPRDLEGARVGVRAYGQTSGVWVRGVLAHEYGVDLDSITWVTMEDAHLAEFVDPPTTERSPSGTALRQLMVDGQLLAIMGERIVDPAGVKMVIADAENAALAWIERTGIRPINHTLAVRNALLAEHSWLAGELMELFERARIAAQADGAAVPQAYGFAANEGGLQTMLDYAAEQHLTPRAYRADELYLRL